MKVKLLGTASYLGMESVDLNTVFESVNETQAGDETIVELSSNDLIAAGAEEGRKRFNKDGVAIFWLKDLEVIQA